MKAVDTSSSWFVLPCWVKIFSSFCQQEEEGDDADISVAPSVSSHSIPLPLPSTFTPLYGARYSETTANTAVATYGGLVAMEDSQDDDPESILDEHVQRVMKTPGCQSPGATNSALGGGGRHSPPKSSRSPEGGTGPPHCPPGRGHGVPPAGVKGELFCVNSPAYANPDAGLSRGVFCRALC